MKSCLWRRTKRRMEMDKMREEFEEWVRRCNKANKIDHMYLNVSENGTWYLDNRTELAWQAWQASRQALVVELPFGECDTAAQDIDALKFRLDSAGIKWTE